MENHVHEKLGTDMGRVLAPLVFLRSLEIVREVNRPTFRARFLIDLS